MSYDEFADVRRDPDPVSRGRRATELLAVYQQRSTELARLRHEALEEAHEQLGMPYSQIATAIGITKGRVTQIRTSAPSRARALFGVGPVTIVLPYRYQVTDRERPLLAAEDVAAGELAKQLLESFGFATRTAQLGPDDQHLPEGDLFVICGPKSSPAVAQLFESDPRLTMAEDGSGWFIENRATNERYRSPLDEASARASDTAYVARRTESTRTITHVAGIHAIGSLGAVEYLTQQAMDLYQATAARDFSLVVASDHKGLTITRTEALELPLVWGD
ncbi:hypothetical protein ABCS02_33590 [Microbacterium sp. X-17]|uniref:hypothetical protein n=1 Tax=Microbacterium sp. X-17 TaxID=3144404 RepID=UPI0031F5D783